MSVRLLRLGMSAAGSTAAEALDLTSAEILAATEAGPITLGNANCSITNLISICHDWSGNLYACDNARNCVVKIEEGGRYTWIAGSKTGVSGNNGTLNDVAAATARFNAPTGIACDRYGTLYVADTSNHQIRVIKNGKVSVLAGSAGLSGFVDGDGETARFNTPTDVTVDRAGVVYVADKNNHAIRKIGNNGTVLTIAGSGGTGNAQNVKASKYIDSFSSPTSITVDLSGNLYVVDTGNNQIKKITPNGWIYLFSGSGSTGVSLGSGSTPMFNCSYTSIQDIEADQSGNIYLVDLKNPVRSRILRLDYNGKPSEVAEFNTYEVNGPYCLTVTPAQKIFVGIIYDDGGYSSSSSSTSSSSSSVDSSSSSTSSSSSSKSNSSSSTSSSSSSSP